MLIFNTDVSLKQELCDKNGKKQGTSEPYVNLYVRVTNLCNACCPFCEFRGIDKVTFDFYKFYYVLNELKKSVKVNKISFTGGEPGLKKDLFATIEMAKQICPDAFIVVNTNGTLFGQLDFDKIVPLVDSIALSRHSFEEDKNDEIFGRKMISDTLLKNLGKEIKKKVHISCNLVKGRVDTADQIKAFMNHFSDMGFHDFGFVSLMSINEFCKDHLVDFRDIEPLNSEELIKTQEYCYKQACCCRNYLYSTKTGISRFYARYYRDHLACDSTLVYDINVLKNGFSGAIII